MPFKFSCSTTPKAARSTLLLAGLMAATMGVHAQTSVVDDYEAGTNQNLFLGYTYYYADQADGGTTVINSADPIGTGTTETWQFDGTKSLDAGANGSKNSLKLQFTYGLNKPIAASCKCAYGQFAGTGTQLVAGTDNGAVLDLSKATTPTLTFWAKSDAAYTMKVEFTTANVTDDGYFFADVTLSTTWTQYTISILDGLGGFARPAWAETATPGVLFDLTKAQKIQFSISADDPLNGTITGGTVDIDNIAITGYKWVPPNACITCVGAFGAGTGALLSSMDVVPTNENAAGGFWYAYNDVGTRAVTDPSQYSEIFQGVDLTNPTPSVPLITITHGVGTDTSNVALIRFTLGPTFQQDTNTIQPFVGIGTKVSDNLGTVFLDASASTGVSFDYWTDTAQSVPYIRLEVKANQVLSTNAGVVHQVLLPSTNGVWESATVPWTTLQLPAWQGVVQTALATNALSYFQWAVQGVPGATDAIAVDNVRLVGMSAIPNINSSIFSATSHGNNGVKITQGANELQFAYSLPQGTQSAEFRLLDLTGAQVARQVAYANNGMARAGISTQNLHSGVYMLQVRYGKDSDAGISMPVTLLR